MSEVRVALYVENGTLKVRVDRINRETKIYEELTSEGRWRRVSLHQKSSPDDGFEVSINRAEDIVAALAKGAA